MRSYINKLAIAASIILVSCGDEQQFYTQYGKAEDGSTRVHFVHAASDTVGVNLFAGDLKITAAGFSTLSTGTVNVGRINFGGDYPVTGYSSVQDASGTLAVVFPETYAIVSNAPVTYASKTMSTSGTALAASGWYTVAFLGVTGNYQTVVYEDDLNAAPLDGKSYIRFANFIHNMGADELTLRATPPGSTTPVDLITDISFKEMSGFIALPVTGQYSDVRIVNETTGAVLFTVAATSGIRTFTENRAYTVFAQGRIGGAGTLGPGIGRMANR